MVAIVQLAAMFLVPAVILRLRRRPFIRLAGPIGTAYLAGILIAAALWLLGRAGLTIRLNGDIGQIGSYAAIGVAIPLLLFGADLTQVRHLTKPVLLSFGALGASVVLTAGVMSRLFGRSFLWGRELCAMSIGLYTGGTPNFNAIGVVLGVDPDAIALGNLSDMLIGGVFYVFLLLAAKPLLRRFLPQPSGAAYYAGTGAENVDDLRDFRLHRGIIRNLLLALLCAAVGAGAGVGLWAARGAAEGTLTDCLVPAVMLAGTVLGVALSLVPAVRSVPENGTAGQYLILVFSFALASSLDFTRLDAGFVKILLLLSLITVVSFAVHILLCRLLKIDTDCALVTLTAGIYGPAFVPALTRQLKNDALTAPGLICGALGYAVGTLLGLGLFYII